MNKIYYHVVTGRPMVEILANGQIKVIEIVKENKAVKRAK